MKLQAPLIVAAISDKDVAPSKAEQLSLADVIELRVDLFESRGIDEIRETFQSALRLFKKPILGTVRDLSEGGGASFPDRALVYDAISPFSTFLDIELAFDPLIAKMKEKSQELGFRIIGSYHNFNETPDDKCLQSIVERGKSLSVDFIKIAVMAHDLGDLIRLLFFTESNREHKMITISMGKVGYLSRLIGGFYGSLMTYGHIGNHTAPGQIELKELKELIDQIYLKKRE